MLPMTYARKTLISLNDTPYYHVVAQCVRRAWLGLDEYAGRDYSHRKAWVMERLSLRHRSSRSMCAPTRSGIDSRSCPCGRLQPYRAIASLNMSNAGFGA